MKRMKKLLAWVLAFVMCLSIVPASTWAAAGDRDSESGVTEITFDKSYSTGRTVNASTAAANGLVAADGFVLGSSITPYEMWAWQDRFLAGYTPDEAEPDGSPYFSFPYGYDVATKADLSVESDTIFGYAYTNGGSCTTSLASMSGEVVLQVSPTNGVLKNELIDSSSAKVQLVAGDGYTTEEWTLNANTLTGSWEKGKLTYTMDVNSLVPNNDVGYTGDMGDTSREWSAFGGDGNGCYTFYLQVSDIIYNGNAVAPVTFPVEVYVFGRDGTDRGEVFDTTYDLPQPENMLEDAPEVEVKDEAVWTYYEYDEEKDNKPILCDDQTDNFFITWPEGVDASGITADDVTITLYADRDEYTLVEKNNYNDVQYGVYTSEGVTQIAVSFMHWAYTPVFKTMTITVGTEEDSFYTTMDYDVASVYAYMVQSGGVGNYPGNVVTFSFYGLDNVTSPYQLAQQTETYTLSTELDDGTYFLMDDGTLEKGTAVQQGPSVSWVAPKGAAEYTMYYTEAALEKAQEAGDAVENAKVTENPREPKLADDGLTLFSENRFDQVVVLDLDTGEVMYEGVDSDNPYAEADEADDADDATPNLMTFTKTLGNGTGNEATYMESKDLVANGVTAAAGYALAPYITPYDGSGVLYSARDDDVETRPIPYEHWAWQDRFQAGWVSASVSGTTPTSFPYVSFPYGYKAPGAKDGVQMYGVQTYADDDEAEEEAEVTISATSDIFGSADTGNKSTLKPDTLIKTSGPGDTDLYYYDADGKRVKYTNYDENGDAIPYAVDKVQYSGSATITISSEEEIDDSKIDSSEATVTLADGDGYYADELILSDAASVLDGEWKNGTYTYTLPNVTQNANGKWEGTEALTWNNINSDGEPYIMLDANSGREWSCFGGDGNGYYTFNFEVSGIKYDGKELDPVQFVVNVYIWGRDGSDMVSSFNATESPKAEKKSTGSKKGSEIQWTWEGDDSIGKPILCDNLTDDFFITWPTGTKYAGTEDITADDVVVTLANAYGDTYTLQQENAYGDKQYSVYSSSIETQVAVTFMHWAYVPVFTTMSIDVYAHTDEEDGHDFTTEKPLASKTYDVGSVYIYMVQQGGGGVSVDGTMTTYSYYGFDNLTSIDQIMTASTYTLSYKDASGTTYYYAAESEDAEVGYLTTNKNEAMVFDGSGEDDTNQQLINQTAWITAPTGRTETKKVSSRVGATAESTIFGNGQRDMRGNATITLDVDEADDSLIDASHVSMELVAGDGYTPEEWILSPENLEVSVEDGTITFTPAGQNENGTGGADILAVNNSADVYDGDMGGASRGWNQFGGDGNGCYTFYMEISGITYDGEAVETVRVPIEYYIYGRDGTDRGEVFDDTYELPTAVEKALRAEQTDEIQWTYAQAEENDNVPNLTDDLTDDFYVTWPKGTNASNITEDDVTITLYADDYEYTLVPVNAYGEQQYSVFSSKNETQIAVTFMHWAYVPVFKTMTITVDDGSGLYAEYSTDIVSVYVYLLQAGGTGSYPGNTVTFNVVGVDYDNIGDEPEDVYKLAQGRETYTLSTNIDGTDYYIMKDGSLEPGIEVPSGPTTMIGPPDGAKEFVQYYTADEAVRDGYTEAEAEAMVVYDPRQPAIDNYCIFSQNRYDQVVYLNYTVSTDSEGNPVLSGDGKVIKDNVSDSPTKASDYVDPDTVDGLAFTKTLGNGTGNGMLHTGDEMVERGVKTLPGYTLAPFISPYDGSGYLYSIRDDEYDDDGNVISEGEIPDRPIPYEHWAWQSRFSAGWVSNEVSGNDFSAFPYVSFPYGYAPQATAEAESTLFGYAYTGGVTCIIDAPLDSMTGEATITLTTPDGSMDDSLIDSSNAVVSIVDGDGYHADEMLLKATTLDGEWENGQITYTMNADDLDWNNQYIYGKSKDGTSLEWSVFGGDGNGCYTFNFEVSGITYDGVEVDPVTFQVQVYIFGRDASDLGKMNYDGVESAVAVEAPLAEVEQTDEVQWTWVGDTSANYTDDEGNEVEKPILCDNVADDFYVIWPEGTDASAITADDVTVTLYSDYGDSYTLSTETAYGENEYSVFAAEDQTQIAVTFMHWPYVPVFTTMTISVDDGNGLTAETTYEIGSVYIYMVQSGGMANHDGQTVTFDFYGIDPESLTDVHQLVVDQTYTLALYEYEVDEDGNYVESRGSKVVTSAQFLCKDKDGNVTLEDGVAQMGGTYAAPANAILFDATEDRDPQYLGTTVYVRNRLNQTETVEIDGEEVELAKVYTEDDGDGNLYHDGEEFEANGIKPARGYVMCETIYPGSPHSMWAWSSRFLSGWTSVEANGTTAESFPYVSYPYGYAAGEETEPEETEPEETEPEETEPEETEPEPTEPTPEPAEPTPEPAEPSTEVTTPTTAATTGTTTASSTAVSATTTTKLIQLRAIGGTKRVTLKWNKVNNADGYLIYGARCGVGYQVIADVTDGATKKYVVDGLEKGKSYKYRVKAYKIVDGEQVILRSSNTTHVYTHGNKKYANAKKVTASKTSVSLSVGKTSTINATITMANSKKKLTTHVKELRYRSNNKKVATVSSTGVITAVKAGTANIYAYSPNGRYAKIKVTVK